MSIVYYDNKIVEQIDNVLYRTIEPIFTKLNKTYH